MEVYFFATFDLCKTIAIVNVLINVGRSVRSTSTASVLVIPAATTTTTPTPTPIIPNRGKIEITKPPQVIRRPAPFHVVLVSIINELMTSLVLIFKWVQANATLKMLQKKRMKKR